MSENTKDVNLKKSLYSHEDAEWQGGSIGHTHKVIRYYILVAEPVNFVHVHVRVRTDTYCIGS